jgi:hypothetical protein
MPQKYLLEGIIKAYLHVRESIYSESITSDHMSGITEATSTRRRSGR